MLCRALRSAQTWRAIHTTGDAIAMHAALPSQNTHLVPRIDIAALAYEQLGHIRRIVSSRQD